MLLAHITKSAFLAACLSINPKNGKVHVFDDIGCLILWFRDQDIKWENEAVIWINDIKTSDYLIFIGLIHVVITYIY